MELVEFSILLHQENKAYFMGPRDRLRNVSRNYFSFTASSKLLLSQETLLLLLYHSLSFWCSTVDLEFIRIDYMHIFKASITHHLPYTLYILSYQQFLA